MKVVAVCSGSMRRRIRLIDIFWKAAKNLGVVKIIVVLYFNDITFINGKYKTKFKKIHD